MLFGKYLVNFLSSFFKNNSLVVLSLKSALRMRRYFEGFGRLRRPKPSKPLFFEFNNCEKTT